MARRAVIRWGWRLFRREWRQQLLVLGLLTAAVAATIWGASVIANVQLANPNYATYGTAAASVTLPGTDPRLAADIAAVTGRWGPADLIENQALANGTTQPVQLRAESPHGHYTSPLLGLVSGSYPAGLGQVALTSQVAALYGAHTGGTWQAAGATWRVTGIVQNPSNLADEFALVAPGQVTHPSQVTLLLGSSPAVQQAIGNGSTTLPRLPAAATFTFPATFMSGLPSATIALVVELLGLVFIGLVSEPASRDGTAQAARPRRAQRDRRDRAPPPPGHDHREAWPSAWPARWPGRCSAWRLARLRDDAAAGRWSRGGCGELALVGVRARGRARGRDVGAGLPPSAKTMARLPVVTALSGRPAPSKAVHRSAPPGIVALAIGLACLAFTGGLAGITGQGHAAQGRALLLLAGLGGLIVGIILLAPLAIGVLAAGAGTRLPVAVRIALRNLVRYRARSGPALAAVTFAVFLATGICLVASAKFSDPLNWSGPNLSGRQLIVGTQQSLGGGTIAHQQRPGGPPWRAGGQPCRPPAHAAGATGVREHAVPGGHAPEQPVEFHRHRVRGNPEACSPRTGSRPARSLPAPTSSPCGQGWRACRTWR